MHFLRSLFKKLPQTNPRSLRTVVAAAICLLFAVNLSVAIVVASWIGSVDPLPAESLGPDSSATIFYDATGQEVLRLSETENRLWVSWDKIPENLKSGFVAIEDERFWIHSGIDTKRILGAALGLLTGNPASGGGSTITQQLVKNITGKRDISIKRKVQEQWSALELERRLSKQRILELYLNIIYLGNGAYGVQAASRGYFGKDVTELNLAECAFIAGLTKNPGRYGSYVSAGLNRQRLVLRQMLQQKKISRAQYDEALAFAITFSQAEVQKRVSTYSWFVDAAIEDIITDLTASYGWTDQVARNKLFNGGLKIKLTQNPQVQKAIDEVFRAKQKDDSLTYFKASAPGGEVPQGAMVVMDPRTGDILGLAGGSGEKQQSRGLNRATQSLRQPGSAIKPLAVYGPAIDANLITEASVFDDVPIHLQGADGQTWDPVNYEGTFGGLTTVRQALAHSNNIVAIRTLFELGLDQSMAFLDTLGITILVEADRNATLALGGLSRGVTVRELAAAYAAIANNGIYQKSRTYSQVADNNGQTLLAPPAESRRVMGGDSAYILTDMMQEVMRSGTGKGFAIQDGRIASAGKSGTTQDVRDKWFAGYTPYLLGVTWFGYDQPRSFPEQAQPKVIWNAVMEAAHKSLGFSPSGFPEPAGLVHAQVCIDSGMLPGPWCQLDGRSRTGASRVADFVFRTGTEPTEQCTVHQPPVRICTLSGGLANPACPPETVVELSYLKKPEPWQSPAPGDPLALDAIWETRELPMCTVHVPIGSISPSPTTPSP